MSDGVELGRKIRRKIEQAERIRYLNRKGSLKPSLRKYTYSHCSKGHPWTLESLYIRDDGNILCRVCMREGQRRRHKAKKIELEQRRGEEQAARAKLFARKFKKTHCRRGHEFTEENIHWTPGGDRRCKECIELLRERSDRKKSKAAQHHCPHCGKEL